MLTDQQTEAAVRVRVELRVNGREHEIEVDTRSSLLDALREHLNHDLAQYHVPVNADVREIEAHWLDEHDPHLNPMGSKGIGELGIVGTAAAVANAVHDATGIRLRELPLRPDRVLEALA